jgi:gamma-carbonic anhydrase
MIIPFGGKNPNISPECFIAPDCVIIGDVTIGPGSSIWFKAVLRGDINWIKIGSCTNIQDGCIVHVSGGTSPTTIGDHVTVGHGAILHGCTIENSCLIGMGSIILDNAVIGEGSLVAAGAMVKSGMKVPPQSLVAGNPAVIKRRISDDEKEYFIEWAKKYYQTSKGYIL